MHKMFLFILLYLQKMFKNKINTQEYSTQIIKIKYVTTFTYHRSNNRAE